MQEQRSILEFGVTGLADIRFLLKAWQQVLGLEGLESTEALMVYVTIEDRRPGDKVMLNFQESQKVLGRFLTILEEGGLKFSCNEMVPGLLTICQVIRKREDLRIIKIGSRPGPSSGPEGNET